MCRAIDFSLKWVFTYQVLPIEIPSFLQIFCIYVCTSHEKDPEKWHEKSHFTPRNYFWNRRVKVRGYRLTAGWRLIFRPANAIVIITMLTLPASRMFLILALLCPVLFVYFCVGKWNWQIRGRSGSWFNFILRWLSDCHAYIFFKFHPIIYKIIVLWINIRTYIPMMNVEW